MLVPKYNWAYPIAALVGGMGIAYVQGLQSVILFCVGLMYSAVLLFGLYSIIGKLHLPVRLAFDKSSIQTLRLNGDKATGKRDSPFID